MDICGPQGYECEAPGGWIFEIGNEWLVRRIQTIGGRIGATSLAHGVSGEEYLEQPVEEFVLVISREGERREISFREFYYVGHSLPRMDDEERLLKIDLEAELDGRKLPVSVYYQARADEDFMRKWLEIPPSELRGWMVESVTLENMKLRSSAEGITPHSRYPQKFPGGEDNVHIEPDNAGADETLKRFDYGDRGRAIVGGWGLDEGLFFFTAHLLGSESFDHEQGLLMRHSEYTPLGEGLTTGAAVIGAYSGPPEIGFKRYREFLARNWCVVGKKDTPVAWNTWLITRKNNAPLLTNYDRNIVLDYLDLICEAGFYDVLQLDLGWEEGWPLAASREKFPSGLDGIVRRASQCGIDMGFWVNPFSSNYWKSDVEEEHPEWLNPGKVSPQSRAHAICHLTDYFDYVKGRFVELVTRYNARVIYWDGGDWNIPECTAAEHAHTSRHEQEALATKRLAEIADAVHDARPNAVITGFNLPFDNHRLSVIDREQVSDTHEFPTVQSELIQRQQVYQMAFEHPFNAISSSWYGVNWHEAGENNLAGRSLKELIHAEMSMIGIGDCEAGGSIDLAQAKPEFTQFLKKMFAWRKKFARYFTVYQHILGFPDGVNIDGYAHIIDGKGFLVLVNPSNEAMSINLPLDEPELELSISKKYKITDWSNFESGRFLGNIGVTQKFEADLAPLDVRIVGVDVSDECKELSGGGFTESITI